MQYLLEVNGAKRSVDVDGDTPLLWVLRDTLDLKGTKFGCGAAHAAPARCIWTASPIRSCQTPVASVGDAAITTIEAIGETKIGQNVQAAWIELDVPQCGYCQAGQIMSATALLAAHPDAHRRRHRRGDERQHLPLRHLHAHPRGHQAGRRSGEGLSMLGAQELPQGQPRRRRRHAAHGHHSRPLAKAATLGKPGPTR